MKNKLRKLLNILTALVMICAMIPAMGITARASAPIATADASASRVGEEPAEILAKMLAELAKEEVDPALASLDSSGTDITAQFPDPKFRQAIREELGLGPNAPITDDAVADVLSLNVFGRGITSLRGIEHFKGLQELDCSYNRLSELDVSMLGKLTKLRCNDNYLTSLSVDGLESLEFLECSSNLLMELGVRSLTQLRILLCGNNQLKSLDARGLHRLETLECRDNILTSLDLGHIGSSPDPLQGLKYLNCRNNMLTSWPSPQLQPGVGIFQSLETFIIGGNLLTQINISEYPKLQAFCCCHNMISKIALHDASYVTSRYDVCIKSNRLSEQAEIPGRFYSDIDFRYNQFDDFSVSRIGARVRPHVPANRYRDMPQNVAPDHVVRIADYPTMTVVGAETWLGGTILGVTGSRAITWTLVQWSGEEGNEPSIENRVSPPGIYFTAKTTGIAIVEAKIANGKAQGVDYVQYIRIEVVEPLSFEHSDEFDIPSTGGEITPVYVGSGVTGGLPPFIFSADGLPKGLIISEDGFIIGKLDEGDVGSAEITVKDAGSSTATITIQYGVATARSYVIGGVNPGGANWFESLDELLRNLGSSWGSISKADITLLDNVKGSTALVIGAGQNITLNLGEYDLIITSTGTAASIGNGGSLTVNGTGTLILDGTGAGVVLSLSGGELVKGQNARVQVDGGLYATSGAAAEVTSVTLSQSHNDIVGVFADGGSKVTVTGNVSVQGSSGSLSTFVGVKAMSANVTIGGSISVNANNITGGTGLSVGGAGVVVTVMGDVTAGVGVHAVSNGAAIYIHGEVNATGTYINFVNDKGENMPVTKEPYPETETVGGVVFYKYIGDMKDVAKPSVVYVRFPGALTGTVTIGLNSSTGLLTANTSAVIGGSGAFTYTWSGESVVNSGTSTLILSTGYKLGQEITLTLTRAGVTGSLTAKITVYQVSGTAQANGTTGTFSIPEIYGVSGDIVTGTYSAGNSTGVTFSSPQGPVIVELENNTATYKLNPDNATFGSGLIEIKAIFEGGSSILYGDVNGDGAVNMTDTAFMNRYLAKWPGYTEKELNMEAADVDLSGDVNLIDTAVLNRFLGKWPEYPKLPHVPDKPEGFQQMATANAPIIGEPVIRIGQAAGKAGETVRIPISLERNSGITGMVFTLDYDETALKLVGYENTGLLAGALHTEVSVLDSATFAWSNPFATTNNTGNGALVYVDFEILEGATIGDTAITLTYKPNNIINADLRPVAYGIVPGSVAVKATPVITAATANFISIVETSRNSGVWALSFTVTETWSDGERKIVPYSIEIRANNANVSGRYDLGSYTLVYDIAGNGSNIKEFRIILVSS